MASIIFQREAPPWKTGGQTIVEYDSGLLRVDLEYSVPTKNLESYLNTFTEGQEIEGIVSPAIDGLFIYTSPSWSDQGNGISIARVSAFGRRYSGLRNISYEVQRITPSDQYAFSVWSLTGQLVIKENEEVNIDELEFDEDWLAPFDFTIFSNPLLSEKTVNLVSSAVIQWQPPIYSSNDFRLRFKSKRVRQLWSATMTDDQNFQVYLPEPTVDIAGQSNFGKFTELDIVSRRQNI